MSGFWKPALLAALLVAPLLVAPVIDAQVLQGFQPAPKQVVVPFKKTPPPETPSPEKSVENSTAEPVDALGLVEAEDVPEDEIDEIFVKPVTTQADVRTTFGEEDGSIILVPVDENGDALQEPGIFSEEAVTPFNKSGSLLFADLAQPAISLDRLEIPAKPNDAISYTLSPRERARARAAWAYFQNNRDPETGFVRTVDTGSVSIENRLTLWDVGSTFAAIESARTLGLTSKADYDRHVRQLIKSLSKIERFQGLPTQVFSASTGRSVGPTGIQARDLGRILVWLAATKRNAPYQANGIDALVASWNFCGLHDQQGTLQNLASYNDQTYKSPISGVGYATYAQKGFELWGFPQPDLNIDQTTRPHRLHGVNLPTPNDDVETLNFETFLLDGLEFGWDLVDDKTSIYGKFTDGWRAEMAHRLFQAQFERFNTEGILTARASHYMKQGDKLVYISNPVLNKGVGFLSSDDEDLATRTAETLSTKAAFASWALWETPYSGMLFEAVGDSFDPERGFPEAVHEGVGGLVDIYSLETNAYVLMSLAFNHQGALLPKHTSRTTSFWDRRRSKRIAQKRQCLPAPVKQRPVGEGCAQVNPLPGLGFVNCSPDQSGPVNNVCTSCAKPRAATNCRFFEQSNESRPVASDTHGETCTVDHSS